MNIKYILKESTLKKVHIIYYYTDSKNRQINSVIVIIVMIVVVTFGEGIRLTNSTDHNLFVTEIIAKNFVHFTIFYHADHLRFSYIYFIFF